MFAFPVGKDIVSVSQQMHDAYTSESKVGIPTWSDHQAQPLQPTDLQQPQHPPSESSSGAPASNSRTTTNSASEQTNLPPDATLIVRSLLAYSFYLIEEEIPKLEHEGGHERLIDEYVDHIPQCHLFAGTILAASSVDFQFIKSNASLADLVGAACAYYMNCDDPWIVENPSGQSRLLGFLNAFSSGGFGCPVPTRGTP
jgi:hypothetical protein